MTSNIIRIRPAGTTKHSGEARWRGKTYPCALGSAGILQGHKKCEGDLATPGGLFALKALYYRADRLKKPVCALAALKLTPDDGWCDAPADAKYNTAVKHPYAASAEVLWRDDSLYDMLLTTNHNSAPAKPGLGSAIFVHIARDDFSATEGCIAFAQNDLVEILKDVNLKTMIRIEVI